MVEGFRRKKNKIQARILRPISNNFLNKSETKEQIWINYKVTDFFRRTLHIMCQWQSELIDLRSKYIDELSPWMKTLRQGRSLSLSALLITPLFLRSNVSFTQHCVYRRPGCRGTRRWQPSVSRYPAALPQHPVRVQRVY